MIEMPTNTKPLFIQGDVLERLADIPDDSIQCCITSPPYFGLRDYGTATWSGGDPECDHKDIDAGATSQRPGRSHQQEHPMKGTCRKCGAIRIDKQIGLEPTLQDWIDKMVEVFREVRRVLRPDGTLWLNIGTSYASCYNESYEYIIRPDISQEQKGEALEAIISAITQALPDLQGHNASAKSNVPQVLQEENGKAAELHPADLSEVREDICSPQGSRGEGECKILQPVMREIGKPNQEEDKPNSEMRNMRETIQQAQMRDKKEQGDESFLLDGMLVQLQPEGQQLSMDRRTERQDESGGVEVEEGGNESGQMALQDLPCVTKAGSASHIPIWDASGASLGDIKRDSTLPELSPRPSSSRTTIRRSPVFHSINSDSGLEKLTIPKNAIPANALHLFQPRYILKPKDDMQMPAQLAIALQADGWYVRSKIIWHKNNPLPESVSDRPTSSYELIFLLTKSARYFYDQDAIREGGQYDSGGVRGYREGNISNDYKPKEVKQSWDKAADEDRGELTKRGRGKTGPATTHESGRNARNVWMSSTELVEMGIREQNTDPQDIWKIPTHPNPLAHFATFPPDLVRLCIAAGTSQEGCCKKCGMPWIRVTEKTESPHDGKTETDYAEGTTANRLALARQAARERGAEYKSQSKTLGFRPGCECDARYPTTRPCICLDPFAGIGTTLAVATRMGRASIGIELNPQYIKDGLPDVEAAFKGITRKEVEAGQEVLFE